METLSENKEQQLQELQKLIVGWCRTHQNIHIKNLFVDHAIFKVVLNESTIKSIEFNNENIYKELDNG